MKNLTTIVLVLVAALVAAPATLAQHGAQPSTQEVSAEVPELSAFHEVIFQLWHDAWPKKDLAALSALLPEIEAGALKIEKAVLPGILRDKKPAWDAGVKKLGEVVARYREAVQKKELQPVLDAAESLHSQFEALARTIRPVLDEVDEFHQVLYRLYHYELPAFELDKIRVSARDLGTRMKALDEARLPARLQSKQQQFESCRADLGRAVADLSTVASAGTDEKAIRAAIETVHTKYQAMEQVF